MPQLNELNLSVRGSGRSAEFFLTGLISYDDSDLSRNGCVLVALFQGKDGTRSEPIGGPGFWWTVRDRDNFESDGLMSFSFIGISPTRTRFALKYENKNTGFLRRQFNEDKPGRDEIYCWVHLRDADGTGLIVPQESNVVSGWF